MKQIQMIWFGSLAEAESDKRKNTSIALDPASLQEQHNSSLPFYIEFETLKNSLSLVADLMQLADLIQ